jgi:ABC-type molybdate transport system ATPase subunit
VRARTGLTVLTVTHDIRGLASRAARIVLLGEGRVQLDGPAGEVFARTAELERWGVLAPPVARLQAELLGPDVPDVLLSVEELAAAAVSFGGLVTADDADLTVGVTADGVTADGMTAGGVSAGGLTAGGVTAGTAGAP